MSDEEKALRNFFVQFVRVRTDTLRKTGPQRRIVPKIKRWHALWAVYKDWCEENEWPLVTYSYFLRIVHEWYPDLKLEERNDLPACIICTKLNELLLRANITSNQLAVVQFARHCHKRLAHGEWTAYSALVALARSPPGDYALIAIDTSPARELPHLGAYTDKTNGLETKWVAVIIETPWVKKRILYAHHAALWQPVKDCKTERAVQSTDAWMSVCTDVIRRDIIDAPEQQRRPAYLVLHLDNTVRGFFHRVVVPVLTHRASGRREQEPVHAQLCGSSCSAPRVPCCGCAIPHLLPRTWAH